MRAHLRVSFLLLLPLALPLSGQDVVVPNGLENVEGGSLNSYPFFCISWGSMRYQQVYLGSEVGPGLIGEIRFRENNFAGTWSLSLSSVVVALSSTSAAPDGLSATFADNVGADELVVFDGPLAFSSSEDFVTRPADFLHAIRLSPPFLFEALAGQNLLLDVTVSTCETGTRSFDAVDVPGDSVSRLYGGEKMVNGTLSTHGLVTLFRKFLFLDGFESGNTTAWSGVSP